MLLTQAPWTPMILQSLIENQKPLRASTKFQGSQQLERKY